jgi:hypothetical protein
MELYAADGAHAHEPPSDAQASWRFHDVRGSAKEISIAEMKLIVRPGRNLAAHICEPLTDESFVGEVSPARIDAGADACGANYSVS